MMLARYKKIANFTFLARWANLAYFMRVPRLRCQAERLASSACISFRAGRATVVAKAARRAAPAEP